MSIATPEETVSPRPSPYRWLARLLDSSVGGKFVVALTGLALTGFVLAHMAGNLQVFLGREVLNDYAAGMKALGPFLWVIRGGLLTVFVAHIGLALRLKRRSLAARPVGYAYERTIEATWASRHMVLTGLVILAFLLYHLAHFTLGWTQSVTTYEQGHAVATTNYLKLEDEDFKQKTGLVRQDVYRMVIDGFRNPIVAVLYVIAQLLLGVHLVHGTRSVFQTLGVNHPKYNRLLTGLAYTVTGLVVAGNVTMPLAIMARLVGSDVP